MNHISLTEFSKWLDYFSLAECVYFGKGHNPLFRIQYKAFWPHLTLEMRDPLFVNSKPLVIHSSFIHLKPIILSKGRYVKRNLEVNLKVFEKQLAHAAKFVLIKRIFLLFCAVFFTMDFSFITPFKLGHFLYFVRHLI